MTKRKFAFDETEENKNFGDYLVEVQERVKMRRSDTGDIKE